MRHSPTLVLLLLLPLAASVSAQTPTQAQLEELKRLSIEELAETDVRGAGRRPEQLGQVAGAISIITSDDLRRYGVMNLPQALRLADALHVAQVAGAGGYAISARGFNISTANKMLVMIDGRTIYSPVFAGVFWEAQDIVIADIERIEVVRGPGGTLWGANAVNGVIHIITKTAAQTRGTYINVAAGSGGPGPFAIRHGGRLGQAGSYRAYAKVRFDDPGTLLAGGRSADHDLGQAGFRVETAQTSRSFAVLQGDLFYSESHADRTIRHDGGNLLGRWTGHTAKGDETVVQAYYDHFYRRVPSQYRGLLNTFDVDVQHQRRLGARHQLVLGGGYRQYRGDDLGDGPGFFFEPEVRISHRANVFAETQIQASREWFITLGSKLEHNEFTGAELQPRAAVRWTRGAQTVWASVAKAVRVPTRFDTDLRFRAPNSSLIALTGSADFKSETVVAYEAGYRTRLGHRLSLDVAGYDNRYDDLRSQESPPTVIPIRLANMLNATTRGVEVASQVQICSWWQANAGYSYFWRDFFFDPGSTDRTRGASEANDPAHLVKVRSYVSLGDRLEVDGFFRHVSSLPQPAVDAYSELDLRIGYRVHPGWELSLIGSNVLHRDHLEFRAGTPPQLYERGVTLRSSWRF